MSEHRAEVVWRHHEGDFVAGTYSRQHVWRFDGGIEVQASPALSSVPVPFANPDCVDPEEGFVASLSSCHMLTFLHLVSRAGYGVLSYEDQACGWLERRDDGSLWMSRVALRPVVVYVGRKPDADEEEALHARAHRECYLANSVKTLISVELVRP